MCATVIVSSTGGPPHSWGALLREGSFSLNHLPRITRGVIRAIVARLGINSLLCMAMLYGS